MWPCLVWDHGKFQKSVSKFQNLQWLCVQPGGSRPRWSSRHGPWGKRQTVVATRSDSHLVRSTPQLARSTPRQRVVRGLQVAAGGCASTALAVVGSRCVLTRLYKRLGICTWTSLQQHARGCGADADTCKSMHAAEQRAPAELCHALCCIAPYRTVHHCTAPYRTVPRSTAQYCTAPHCTAPYRTVPQVHVEELALEHYGGEEGGGWRGMHAEGGIWATLFGLLMWDVLFGPGVPDVFRYVCASCVHTLNLHPRSFGVSFKVSFEAWQRCVLRWDFHNDLR